MPFNKQRNTRKRVISVKKRIIPVAIILALLLCIGVSAAQPRVSVVATPKLSFSGTTANCSAAITSPDDEISATLTLWRGNRVIDSWSETATSAVLISGSCTVTEGLTYTLRLTGTIDGTPIQVVSVSGTC